MSRNTRPRDPLDNETGQTLKRKERTPLSERRCPLPRANGFLMPFLWFLYDWLWAVWLVDFAISARTQRL